jgi:hypothetical protein
VVDVGDVDLPAHLLDVVEFLEDVEHGDGVGPPLTAQTRVSPLPDQVYPSYGQVQHFLRMFTGAFSVLIIPLPARIIEARLRTTKELSGKAIRDSTSAP